MKNMQNKVTFFDYIVAVPLFFYLVVALWGGLRIYLNVTVAAPLLILLWGVLAFIQNDNALIKALNSAKIPILFFFLSVATCFIFGVDVIRNRFLSYHIIPSSVVFFYYYAFTNKPFFLRKICLYTLPIIVSLYISSIVALRSNPNILRSIQNIDDYLASPFIGDIGFEYFLTVVSTILIGRSFSTSQKYKMYYWVVWSAVVLEILFASFTTMLFTASVSAVLAFSFGSNRKSSPNTGVFLASVLLIVLWWGKGTIGELALSFLDKSSMNYQRISALLIEESNVFDETSRFDFMLRDVKAIARYPLFGLISSRSSLERDEKGGLKVSFSFYSNHTFLLDVPTLVGLPIGFLFWYSLYIPFRRKFYDFRLNAIKYPCLLATFMLLGCDTFSSSLGVAFMLFYPILTYCWDIEYCRQNFPANKFSV